MSGLREKVARFTFERWGLPFEEAEDWRKTELLEQADDLLRIVFDHLAEPSEAVREAGRVFLGMSGNDAAAVLGSMLDAARKEELGDR